jgi:hypothetical protein
MMRVVEHVEKFANYPTRKKMRACKNGDVDEQVDIVLICNLEESQKGSLPQLSLHLMRPGLWSK